MYFPSAHMNDGNEITDAPLPFRLSRGPVVAGESAVVADHEQLQSLPRTYGKPVVFAIARDPKSLFVYWDIDWSNAFRTATPRDRKATLRISDANGSEIDRIAIEPLAGSVDVPVTKPASSLQVEIGYFDPQQDWHSLGKSDPVIPPSDKIGALAPGDFALVPFHITFQRLTELFHATKRSDESLTQSLARLEEKTADPAGRNALTAAEQEVYRAMKAGTSERKYIRRAEFDRADEARLQKKLERIIGFGSSSPANGFAGSSRPA